MSSYFASLTSSATISSLGTRLNSLRRAITSGEEADDPDNEDCSHISNVLRAYYTEKGRPFPAWLPPDPKAPASAPRMVATQASLQQGGYGQAAATPGSRGGGLGDLWGDSGSSQPPASQTGSLRNRSAASPRPATAATPASTLPAQLQTGPPPQARPLPSQRAGSYQTTSSAQARLGPERTGSTGSAQERLRARLNGGASSAARSHSPGRPWEQKDSDGGYTAYGGGNTKRVGLPSGPKPQGR
ncbi:hypothetical protein VTN77DRAFT_5432 [Rasamsonia byssochlamydoides]|uniref:uncharacterized protein n=1 Tax=Rasamsonia byssochlamydoides TaxID=89139 RepID=UPI0037432247